LIPPSSSPIRPKASITSTHHLTNNNIHIPSKPSLIDILRQSKNSNNETTKSKNLKKYKCDICSRAFSRSNTLVTHKVKKIQYSTIENSFFSSSLLAYSYR
jgi:hypothetical protein